ncbi:LOW QUALITY PROTEIN: inactive rhomboid protein 1-like [Xenia sp. Carnegie-2017]|uniref:LOW QUALITY PROTEIN: inactive rhomboid protein 1-like n=1 Tax=Xenia sp. Carnegie-2017 TaxID=2897299 RepID=UPI001F03B687|nr:LOW QUALITY PROTEIN: inactive rhomboid protein 1-like [Xenia sp. Carnegie-2017]
MDGTYQPTTEPTSPNERTGCGFRSLWQRSRGSHAVSLTDSQSDSDDDENAQPKKSKRVSSKKNYRQLCRPLPCIPDQASGEGPSRAASKTSLGSTLERDVETEKQSPPGSKWNLVRSKIKKGTEDFFCICEDEQQRQLLQQKWMARRKRYCSKMYGQLVNRDQVDGGATPGYGSARSSISHQNINSIAPVNAGQTPVLQRARSRKESVASMAWQGLKVRILGGDFPRAMAHGDMIGKGRSFAPATLANLTRDEEDGVFESAPTARNRSETLMRFSLISPLRPASTQSSLPAIREDDEVDGPRDNASPKIDIVPELPEKFRQGNVKRNFPLSLPTRHGVTRPQEERGPLTGIVPSDPVPRFGRQISTASQRGNRINRLPHAPPVPISSNRRQIGKGLVGRWLNRTIKKQRLTSDVKEQMNSLEDHRPYFTYWISFVQTTILIITLAVYGFASVGFTVTERIETVHRSRGGYLTQEKVVTEIPDNFWIGPSRDALIQLGAKYAPCMRKDKELSRLLKKERKEEAETGCCIGTDQNGCIQKSQEQCKRTFSTLHKFSANNSSRVVCGQDPESCLDPPSVKPNEWPPFDITKWPVCKKLSDETKNDSNYAHLSCRITGRPCCIRDQAECRIISKEYCDFLHGVYHEEATLCSQVDCLGATCGLLPFSNPETPDQIYRLWLSLFLHAGILHLCITLIFHFTILKDMEKFAGWFRIAIIYIFSGMGGNLLSALVTPYQPEVGPSGALFGIIACLLVELVQNWQIIKTPLKNAIKLVVLTFILLLVGCLPWVDNFAHLGGLLFGILLGFAFLPYITFGVWDRRRKIIQIVVSLGLSIAIFTILCILFFVDQKSTCSGCHYLNCIPLTENFCSPALGGRGLSPRITDR